MDLIKEEELQKYGITREALVEKFFAQLQKDFEMSGLASYLTVSNALTFEEIKSQVQDALNKISASSSSKLQELIYRVDIPDKHYSDAFAPGNENPLNVLAELIVKRVLQKVILKIVYSK